MTRRYLFPLEQKSFYMRNPSCKNNLIYFIIRNLEITLLGLALNCMHAIRIVGGVWNKACAPQVRICVEQSFSVGQLRIVVWQIPISWFCLLAVIKSEIFRQTSKSHARLIQWASETKSLFLSQVCTLCEEVLIVKVRTVVPVVPTSWVSLIRQTHLSIDSSFIE